MRKEFLISFASGNMISFVDAVTREIDGPTKSVNFE